MLGRVRLRVHVRQKIFFLVLGQLVVEEALAVEACAGAERVLPRYDEDLKNNFLIEFDDFSINF